MILSLPDPESATRWCMQQRKLNRMIGYTPTMGALHPGHLSLVARATRENDITCASIFVNPLQFDRRDDLLKYPHNLKQDIAQLDKSGCDMVYTGTLAQFFPETAAVDEIRSSGIGISAAGLEAKFRPGHLEGVRTIVERLFKTVGACNAYFGEKDFQQTLVVRNLAKQLDGVNIVVCPTVRERSGLAMSSRNCHLHQDYQAVAAKLYQALLAARAAWQRGTRTAGELELIMRAILTDDRLRVEYAEVRDPENWTEHAPRGNLQQARALIAAYVDDVRLIDNLSLDQEQVGPGPTRV